MVCRIGCKHYMDVSCRIGSFSGYKYSRIGGHWCSSLELNVDNETGEDMRPELSEISCAKAGIMKMSRYRLVVRVA